MLWNFEVETCPTQKKTVDIIRCICGCVLLVCNRFFLIFLHYDGDNPIINPPQRIYYDVLSRKYHGDRSLSAITSFAVLRLVWLSKGFIWTLKDRSVTTSHQYCVNWLRKIKDHMESTHRYPCTHPNFSFKWILQQNKDIIYRDTFVTVFVMRPFGAFQIREVPRAAQCWAWLQQRV